MKQKKNKEFKSKVRDRLKIGHYEPVIVEKGVNETFLPLKEGKVFWMVNLGDGGSFDVERQEDAEILSRLIGIDKKLNKLLRRERK